MDKQIFPMLPMRGKNTVLPYALLAACFVFFALFMLWPIGLTLGGGFHDESGFTLRHFSSVLRDPVLRTGLLNSFLIALCTTTLSLLIAVPLGVITTAYTFRGKRLLSALLLVPLILPPFVGAIGLKQLLGQYGAINTLLGELGLINPANPIPFLGGARFWGIVALEALHLYPIIYLNASASLANIDPALEQAAENLGASRWQRFRRITLPLMLPGIFAGGTIVFIWSFTELGTPLIFDYYTVTPVQIFFSIQEAESSGEPYALTAITLLLAALLYLFSRWAVGGRAYAMTTRAAWASHERPVRGWKAALIALPPLAVGLLAALPHVGVVIASFSAPGAWYQSVLPTAWTTEHYAGALNHPLVGDSIRNSLIYAGGAMAVDLVLGVAIAWLIVRAKVKGAALLDALTMLPLAVPGLVLAFGYVAMSVQITGWFRDAGSEAPAVFRLLGEGPNPILFLIIAYAVRRLPYVVRAAVAGLEQTSVELEEASANLGASLSTTLRRVTLPLIAANLIAGGLLAFSFAMLEVSDSLILAQTERDAPLTKAIYELFDRLGDGPYIAAAMGVWAMALLTVTLVSASVLIGKKLGAVFRV